VPYALVIANLRQPWPSLAERPVTVGGAVVSYAEALRAAEILAVSRTSAIMPVLRAAGNPLFRCDYFAAASPYITAARAAPKTGRAGAAGRHVTKNAFIESVAVTLVLAREQELAAALDAFAADERYAVAIARDAAGIRERAYISGVRSVVRAVVTRAVAACGLLAGQFTCSEVTACGTGACRLSGPAYRGTTAAAAAGKFTRPANHVRAGEGFTDAGAAAELAAGGSYSSGVQVWDADALAAGEAA
jgi:hypothetical protein